jgi:hypothetical protein
MESMFVAINKVNGGFILELNGETQVVTSLNKAIKIAREFLNDSSDGVESEE